MTDSQSGQTAKSSSPKAPAAATNAGLKQSKYHDAEIEAIVHDERGFTPIEYEDPGHIGD